MSKRSWLVLATLLSTACGSKAPTPSDVAVPTEPAPTTAVAEADATTPPTIAPPATHEPASGATVTVEQDAATPSADVAPPAEDATPTTSAQADTTPLPADLPVVPGIPPEVVARILGADEGCVGMGKSGRSVVSIVSYGGQKWLRVTDPATPDRGFGENAMAIPTKDNLLTDPATETMKNLRLVPCVTTLVDADGTLTVPKSVPVKVLASAGSISVQIEGNKAIAIDAAFGDVQYFEPSAAYWSDEIGNFYLRLTKEGADVDSNAPDSYGTAQVSATELGLSECVARPAEGKALPSEPPAAFTANLSTPSCIAMTADGQQAAFRIFDTIEGESGPNTVQWFGAGTPPTIDLSCFARSCSAAQKATAEADAKTAGLIACADAKGGVVVDGMVVPWMYQADQLKLKTTTGWRSVHQFEVGREGGPAEKMWRTYQHPGGGPIFVYVGTESGGQSKASVLVMDDAAMKLCDKPPAGTLKVTEVKTVSAAPDGGGYKFGGQQLVDGDVSSSWQPAAKASADTTKPWVELELAAETELAAIEIANGFQRKDGNGDMFALNARVQEGTLTFSDGSTEKVAFGPDERGFKRFELAGKKTSSVKLTIDSLHQGARWPNDLAISEIRLIGK